MPTQKEKKKAWHHGGHTCAGRQGVSGLSGFTILTKPQWEMRQKMTPENGIFTWAQCDIGRVSFCDFRASHSFRMRH